MNSKKINLYSELCTLSVNCPRPTRAWINVHLLSCWKWKIKSLLSLIFAENSDSYDIISASNLKKKNINLVVYLIHVI